MQKVALLSIIFYTGAAACHPEFASFPPVGRDQIYAVFSRELLVKPVES